MPEISPLEFVDVEPAGYCDPETGRCVTPQEREEPEDVPRTTTERRNPAATSSAPSADR